MGDYKRPLILASADTLRFAVVLDAPSPDGGFHCLDIMTIVGTTTEVTRAAWMAEVNTLNGQSRVVRGWVDPEGDVVVGMNIICREGVTEAYIVEQFTGWHRAALLLADRSPDEAAESDAEDAKGERGSEGAKSRGEVVH